MLHNVTLLFDLIFGDIISQILLFFFLFIPTFKSTHKCHLFRSFIAFFFLSLPVHFYFYYSLIFSILWFTEQIFIKISSKLIEYQVHKSKKKFYMNLLRIKHRIEFILGFIIAWDQCCRQPKAKPRRDLIQFWSCVNIPGHGLGLALSILVMVSILQQESRKSCGTQSTRA